MPTAKIGDTFPLSLRAGIGGVGFK